MKQPVSHAIRLLRLGVMGLLLGWVSTVAVQGRPLPPTDQPGSEAIERAIIHLELEHAAKLALQTPDAKTRLYYQVRILFVQYLVAEPQGATERFLSLCKSTLQALNALPASDLHKTWLMSETFFLRGVIRALNQQYVTAAVDFKSACNLLLQSKSQAPALVENKKLSGIFHVAMATLPRKLQWVGNVLCFKGDLELGLRELETVASKGKMLPVEAHVLLFYFEKNLLSRPEAALARAEMLKARFPSARLANYLLLTGLLEMRDNDRAIALAEQSAAFFERKEGFLDMPIWHYSVGKAYFFELNYPKAASHFEKFLNTYQGRTLKADAIYRKGMAYLLMDNFAAAKKEFQRFSGLPTSEFDADEYARQQAAQYILNPPSAIDHQLYAARNLFDGGYYQRAHDSLMKLSPQYESLSTDQKTEYHYRLGRIYHAEETLEKAKNEYQACMALQPAHALWMKVYAIHYLGRIEDQGGNKEKAKTLYKLALSYDHYPYQSGLEQRTKTALAELKSGNP